MRQLVFAGDGKVEWREVPDARLTHDGGAIVRPLALGRCDLDAGFVHGLVPMAPGEAIGHEMIGEIVELGDQVKGFREGQKVFVTAQIFCGICTNCKRGYTGRCESVPFGASFGMGREGGFGSSAGDLVYVPYAGAMMVPLPAGADPLELIGVADMALDSWRAVGPHLKARPGASVLVAGGLASVIGIYAAGIAKAMGAGQVDYWDENPARGAEAAKYGARVITQPDALAEGYSIVVDASGDAQMLVTAIRYAEPEAIVTSVCMQLSEMTALPQREMYHKGITYVTGRPNLRPAFEDVLTCCRAHGFRPELVTTEVYDFDAAPEAWMDVSMRSAAHRPSLYDA
ncbi:alcohol dehydrogenase catalytic domain-containing protein [Tepidicaulis sp.]|uniref:alcohol dehydrogenase catalytic domain-containing protein n=1 Tax=Tepidicaulis sp. TaxID=1920809 RepID=UPI003B58FC04